MGCGDAVSAYGFPCPEQSYSGTYGDFLTQTPRAALLGCMVSPQVARRALMNRLCFYPPTGRVHPSGHRRAAQASRTRAWGSSSDVTSRSKACRRPVLNARTPHTRVRAHHPLASHLTSRQGRNRPRSRSALGSSARVPAPDRSWSRRAREVVSSTCRTPRTPLNDMDLIRLHHNVAAPQIYRPVQPARLQTGPRGGSGSGVTPRMDPAGSTVISAAERHVAAPACVRLKDWSMPAHPPR